MVNESLELVKIWNVGKELCLSCLGNEERILDTLKCMEKRDNRNESLSRGELNVLDDEHN